MVKSNPVAITPLLEAHLPKKPGFLPNLGVTTKFFPKKTRFLSPGASRSIPVPRNQDRAVAFPEKSGDGDILTRAIDNFGVGTRHGAVSSIAVLSIVTSDRAIDDFRVGTQHRTVSRVALLSMLIFDRQFLRQHRI